MAEHRITYVIELGETDPSTVLDAVQEALFDVVGYIGAASLEEEGLEVLLICEAASDSVCVCPAE